MINYSFIIPNRNSPELLRRCLDSIPGRDDIQIIVSDDHSDPEAIDFENYPGLDERCVTVLFAGDPGTGAGCARNRAMQVAEGRWLVFVDSDDFLLPGFLEAADSHLEDDSDIVFFDVTSVHSEDLSPSDRHLSRSVFFTRYDGARREYCCRYLYTEPWGKMFKASFVKEGGFTFDGTRVCNDFSFSVATGLAAKKIGTDAKAVYCVTERTGSVSRGFILDEEQLRTRLDVYFKVQHMLDDAHVSSYPFYRLVKYVMGQRKEMLPTVREFCEEHALSYRRTLLKTRALAAFFALWHRSWWSIF